MKFSLYQRLTLALFALFVAVTGVFFWWSHNIEQLSRYEAEQRLHISLASHLAADNPLLKQGGYDHKALENMFHTLMILGPSFEFYFVDPEGKIITYSAEPGKVKRKKINIKPLKQLIENNSPLPIFGDDPRDLGREKIFSAAAIYNNDSLQGYLYIIIGSEIYDSIFSGIQSNQQLAQSIGLVFGAVIFFFMVLLGLLRFLTYPLKALTEDIRNFRRAGFDKSRVKLRQWPKAENNEIHELGLAFNEMAEQINQQFNQLKFNDKQRKQLLAHLSHDLRTPLASLQGYLETVELKGKNLSEEQHKRFIGIAFKNASQLKHLIDQIFELAHLESGQSQINLEQFPIAELLYDIVAKFSLPLADKHLTINIIPQQCHTLITSDVAKLERVLTNLIENAIRHSSAGGTINLVIIDLKDGRIKVDVIDQGTGIPEDDLQHVFEARYRASNAVDDVNPHNGLGLAISQQLMHILNSEIKVKSKLNNGAIFSLILFAN